MTKHSQETLEGFARCREIAMKIAEVLANEGVGPAESVTSLSLCLGGTLGFVAVAGGEEFAQGALQQIATACLADIKDAVRDAEAGVAPFRAETVH